MKQTNQKTNNKTHAEKVYESWKGHSFQEQIFSTGLEELQIAQQDYDPIDFPDTHKKVINKIFNNIEKMGNFSSKPNIKGFYSSKDLMMSFIKEGFPSKLKTKYDLPIIEVIIRKEDYH